MTVVGLCGMSGAGKTSVLEILEKKGYAVCDCDKVARQVTEKGTPCLDELTGAFGEGILTSDGSLNRRKLAEIAFADEKMTKRLNGITHRYITQALSDYLEAERQKGTAVTVLDAPTLFESGMDRRCHLTVALFADREACVKRICERDGISRESAEKRLDRQKTKEELIRLTDIQIENNGSMNDLRMAVEALAERIEQKR